MKPTQERLRKLIHYNPKTGIFTWRVTRGGRASKGAEAGTIIANGGYKLIAVDGVHYYASKLAWLYVYGYWPENVLLFKNNNPSDLRIKNLQQGARSCALRNMRMMSTNTSGVTGVSFDKSRGDWIASISMNCKNVYCGRFKSFADAVRARWDAEVLHGYPKCKTTSTAYSYLKGKNLI